jgi:hypothetical protein
VEENDSRYKREEDKERMKGGEKREEAVRRK